MIDLHTHSLFSDGELLPSELVRRAQINGYQTIAITDHADISNYDFIIPRIVKACQKINERKMILAVPGIEFTHINPEDIPSLSKEARMMGALIIVVHGETIVEPVEPGTNRKAIESDIDILAHPGLITDEEVKLAAKNGVFLEVSSRNGHSLSNGHVVKLAKKYGAKLVLNTDAHAPDDLICIEKAEKVAIGSGLTCDDFTELLNNSKSLVKNASKRT
jgi:histidinol phosphatase-like PHP family hydrolase